MINDFFYNCKIFFQCMICIIAYILWHIFQILGKIIIFEDLKWECINAFPSHKIVRIFHISLISPASLMESEQPP